MEPGKGKVKLYAKGHTPLKFQLSRPHSGMQIECSNTLTIKLLPHATIHCWKRSNIIVILQATHVYELSCTSLAMWLLERGAWLSEVARVNSTSRGSTQETEWMVRMQRCQTLLVFPTALAEQRQLQPGTGDVVTGACQQRWRGGGGEGRAGRRGVQACLEL